MRARRRSRGRRGRGARDEGAFSTINITPFTDVLLVLLIIFMIAGSSLVPSGLRLSKLAAGVPDDGTYVSDKKSLRVEIGAVGAPKLIYNGRAIDETELAKLGPRTPVVLAIDPGATAERVVRVYDSLLKAGLIDVEWGPPNSTGGDGSSSEASGGT